MTSEDRPAQRARAGQWLRAQRERHDFKSAAELARAIGTTKEVVWSYESGRSFVPDERAEVIAEAFGMDVIEVRQGLGLWVPPAPEDDIAPVPEGAITDTRLLERVEQLLRRRKQRQLDYALRAIEEGDRDAG